MEFNIVGQGDPFLHVKLNKGERLICESDAMVMMESTLELKGEMRGGFFQALGRRLANGESFFQQSIEAVYGNGETLLSPNLPGDILVLECMQGRQYRINDGAFLASSDGVKITARTQGIGKALFGGSGGFFIGETSGQGKLVVGGFGTIFELDVQPNMPVIIDNNHVVAWDDNLEYEVSLSTTKSKGFFGNLVNSVTSGEGIVTKFTGSGKVVVCSRNRSAFVSWLGTQILPNRSSE
jgi:uncharacterized protein (TIGR00266 family)